MHGQVETIFKNIEKMFSDQRFFIDELSIARSVAFNK